jgi:hypothetical protein
MTFSNIGSHPAHIAILGPGGYGKTTLTNAVLTHHCVKEHFRGARYFVACESVFFFFKFKFYWIKWALAANQFTTSKMYYTTYATSYHELCPLPLSGCCVSQQCLGTGISNCWKAGPVVERSHSPSLKGLKVACVKLPPHECYLGGALHCGQSSLSGEKREMGVRGCRGSLSGSQLAWLGSGLGFTLVLLQPILSAHLFGKRALVSLCSFVRCELASTELALLVWGALGCLSSLLAFLP